MVTPAETEWRPREIAGAFALRMCDSSGCEMQRYLLSPHAYVCAADGHAVFLDLKRDRYSALDPGDIPFVRDQIRGWSTLRLPDPAASADDNGANAILQQLLDEGLVTDDERRGKEVSCVQVPAPAHSLYNISPLRPKAEELRVFLSACAAATWMLRRWSIQRTVEWAREMKTPTAHEQALCDSERVAELVGAYYRLQPFAFSPVNACLRNSLTLLLFLRRFGCFPTWFFGVAMAPWAAHSWLQHDGLLLNDSVTHIRKYVPILAV